MERRERKHGGCDCDWMRLYRNFMAGSAKKLSFAKGLPLKFLIDKSKPSCCSTSRVMSEVRTYLSKYQVPKASGNARTICIFGLRQDLSSSSQPAGFEYRPHLHSPLTLTGGHLHDTTQRIRRPIPILLHASDRCESLDSTAYSSYP